MTNFMSSSSQSEAANGPQAIPNRRLWFEFAASAIAWHCLGALDMVIVWRACVHLEQFGSPSSHPGARILQFALWITLFSLTALAGGMSYRTWRTLSDTPKLLRAEGRERKEFMSLSGLFISVSLGVGFLWMCLPLFILQMCERAR